MDGVQLWLVVAGIAAVATAGSAQGESPFVRAGIDSDRPVWGLRSGIRFAIWPGEVGGFPGDGGPRGLIRVGYPVLPGGAYSLVNFIAVEPIIDSRYRMFSELEPSATDGRPGKVIAAGSPPESAEGEWDSTKPYPGRIDEPEAGVQRLTVCLRVEAFECGAKVYILASVRTDRPDELMLALHPEADSIPMSSCVLTATMGNFERLREVRLRDRVARAADLYGDYTGDGFATPTLFPHAELPRADDGSLIVAATTDEEAPAEIHPDPDRSFFWWYAGKRVTQYWRKYPGAFSEATSAQVNARYVYWASTRPIPHGVAFENFELVEPFEPGQTSVFGITEKSPQELLGSKEASIE